MPNTTPKSPGTGDRPLRCGVVGVGRMGQHHARVYANEPGCHLVGVVDASFARAQEIADRHESTAFRTEQDLLDAGVDAVSIAVPTTAHYRSARPFIEAAVGCLIEKPLAGDTSTAREIKALAEAAGAVLMVGHIERYNPVMRAMRKATEDGLNVLPRFIEVMLMGGEEPDEIQAAGVAVVTEHEDICNARLTWHRPEGTCVANITASRLALKTERLTRITGENAYIKIDYGNKSGTVIRRTANEIQMREVREQLRKGEDLTRLNWAELVNIEPLTIDDAEPLLMELRGFIDAVRSGRRPPIDAEAGFANVRTAERIVQTVRETMGAPTGSPA